MRLLPKEIIKNRPGWLEEAEHFGQLAPPSQLQRILKKTDFSISECCFPNKYLILYASEANVYNCSIKKNIDKKKTRNIQNKYKHAKNKQRQHTKLQHYTKNEEKYKKRRNKA